MKSIKPSQAIGLDSTCNPEYSKISVEATANTKCDLHIGEATKPYSDLNSGYHEIAIGTGHLIESSENLTWVKPPSKAPGNHLTSISSNSALVRADHDSDTPLLAWHDLHNSQQMPTSITNNNFKGFASHSSNNIMKLDRSEFFALNPTVSILGDSWSLKEEGENNVISPISSETESLPFVVEETDNNYNNINVGEALSSMLLTAIKRGDVVAVEEHYSGAAKSQINHILEVEDSISLTALMVAVKSNQLEIVKRLIQLGACSIYCGTHAEICTQAVSQSNSTSKIDSIAGLLSHIIFPFQSSAKDPPVIETSKIKKTTPLHLAVSCKFRDIVDCLLKGFNDVKADIDSQNEAGFTPLHIAAKMGDFELVETLVIGGCDVNVNVEKAAKDGDMCPGTPLHQAATGRTSDHYRIMDYLIKSGANVNSKDQYKITPLFWACDNRKSDSMKHALLLLDHGAELNINSTGASPLSYAARSVANNEGCVELGLHLLRFSHPDIVYRASVRSPDGMYMILTRLALEPRYIGSFKLNLESSLLYPGETSFHSSDETPAELDKKTSDEVEKEIRGFSENRRVKYVSKFFDVRYGTESIHLYSQLRFRKICDSIYKIITQQPTKVKLPWYEVNEYFIPIKYPISTEFLRACIYIADHLDVPELFHNSVLQDIVHASWISYGAFYHILHFSIFLILVLCVIITNYNYHIWSVSGDAYRVVECNTLLAIIIIINFFLFGVELLEIVTAFRKSTLKKYLLNFQNYLIVSCNVLVFYATITRWQNSEETAETASIMSVASVLLCLKCLHYLRPFRKTGPFVLSLFFCFEALFELLIVLLLIIFSFAQAFYLLTYDLDESDFSDPKLGVAWAFLYIFPEGTFTIPQMRQSSNPDLAIFLLCLYIFCTTILTLNLLIAILNSQYIRVEKNKMAEWNREKAKMMIDQLRFPRGFWEDRNEGNTSSNSEVKKSQYDGKKTMYALKRIADFVKEATRREEHENYLLLKVYRETKKNAEMVDAVVTRIKSIEILLNGILSRLPEAMASEDTR